MKTRKWLLAVFCVGSLNAFSQGWGFGGNGSSGLSTYTSKKDVNYVGDGKDYHTMDIYYPQEEKASYPVIIHIYGSAWSSNNSKGSADLTTVGEGAVKAGYIFVTPNHRANNDAQWPGQINDIKAVVRYLRGNAKSLKIDTSFIAISGFSSGAHLATMMGTSRNVKEYTVGSTTMDIEGKLGQFTDFSSSVDAVCDWSGPVILDKLDCGSAMDLNSFISPMMGNCSAFQCPDKYALATAVTFMDPSDPPHLLIHGSEDVIVAQCQSQLFYEELQKNNIESKFIPTGGDHSVNTDKVPDMIEFFNAARLKKTSKGGEQDDKKEEKQDGDQDSKKGGNGTIIAAGEYPLSYTVENTGADCEDPVSLNKNNLKSCKTLPNPFEWADGSGKVTDFCDWSCRRNEIKREIEFWEIGEKPKFDDLEASYSNGTLTVKIHNGSNTLTLTSKLSIPSGKGPHPIVIGMDNNTGSLNSSYFSKCIQVPFTHKQIAEYNSGFGGNGRSQNDPFYKFYPNTFNTKADYCAWSWGISRLIDGLEIVKDQIDADLSHIAVTGCSYAGKMALFAGAFDERVALTIAQESGGGGINAWRVASEIGSSVEGISNTNYDWFLSSFKNNFQSQIDKLPYDHHELIAMIAPRAFLAFGNPGYTWLGDEAGYASLRAAEEVWKSMGIEDRFGYVIEGGHDHCNASSNQNKAAQAFINKFLYCDDSQNTKIRTSSVNKVYNSGKYDWGGHTMVNNGCGNGSLSGTDMVYMEGNGNQLFQCEPNPASDETTVSFSLAQNSFVTIELYNSIGVKVMDIASGDYSEGNHSLTFSVNKLPQGIYFYVMNATDFADSKKLIVK